MNGIILCIALFEIIPLYEIFPLGIIHGIVSGGLESYCRSFFGLLIPPGSEAAFYALYAATDKGSSFIGPAVIGILIDATGQVRTGFFFIAVLIVLPIPLVWMANAEKGRRDALVMADSLKNGHKSHREATDGAQKAEGLLARES
ncbi:MFS transporter family protein [Penicillium antarcticum]|uniref:MFS transporter family protein n=1 Tax=Penicillium antarcticum TaxID=416450 RepID=UPI00239E92E6|nr:MFS transporter family protein [Penicillium antarcticum]KAJ5306523.1 MFS transporter family protein [Penicillium antarcticum]